MSSSFAKRVPVFVAGVLAFDGLRWLLWAPHYLLVVKDSILFLGCLITGLGLPLGIGILLGSARALRLTRIYLGLGVIMVIASLLVSTLHLLPSAAPQMTWQSVPDMCVPLTMFVLLLWSTSPRFQHEPGA
jgi:hypothetical protein